MYYIKSTNLGLHFGWVFLLSINLQIFLVQLFIYSIYNLAHPTVTQSCQTERQFGKSKCFILLFKNRIGHTSHNKASSCSHIFNSYQDKDNINMKVLNSTEKNARCKITFIMQHRAATKMIIKTVAKCFFLIISHIVAAAVATTHGNKHIV